ncbi:glucokinase [marine gamma proteobacterium HTCC2143]|jgi:glucokinase|uniref:Glucokinase n=1 Tax=marine gamma proteobacterium HTCC2143 TaxID=247633 RepID=A0YBK9_9GAMM|nr:glucokinase [marine gamma proteobacterium HTCC2143]
MNKPVHIVADIGGTNARFAYVQADSNELLGIEIFPCAEFPFLRDAIRAYMERGHVDLIDEICLAVAGPVESDWIDLPNNHWAFSRAELQQSLDASVSIINDFSAQVLSIDTLSGADLKWIGTPRPADIQQHVVAVLGPGTGLGVSAMLSTGEILPSEAGHVAFAPTDEHECDLLKVLWQRYQRVSVERILSGMGLANLYWANCRLAGFERELTAADISAGAHAGDKYCLRAVNDFCAILGSVAGEVALMMGATDGVYVSGGIIPRLIDLLDEDLFRRRFDEKGRFREICAEIPLAIMLAKHPGLQGCVKAINVNKYRNMRS